MILANNKLLKGRVIQEIRLQRWSDKVRGITAYDPVIVLDNGAMISFSVQETESGEYGIKPNYHPCDDK